MIKNLRIERYKSIRELEMSCKRINIFVGAPDTGKTNILEALGLWCPEIWENAGEWLRVERTSQLFCDLDSSVPVRVTCDDWRAELAFRGGLLSQWEFAMSNDRFPGGGKSVEFTLDGSLGLRLPAGRPVEFEHPNVKFFAFDRNVNLDDDSAGSLKPVSGKNVAAILLSNKSLRRQAAEVVPSGFQLQVTPHENKVSFFRDADGVAINLPYKSLSETMRRLLFQMMILETNKNCTIVLDEPEAHTFPVFTKLMAERMACYSPTLQFFLTTHSPFMLTSLIEKTPLDELNVIYCRMENFETKAYPLDRGQVSKILEWDMDAFFNFDRLVDSE